MQHSARWLACVLLLSCTLCARAAPARSDDFLAGYASAVLEQELGWPTNSYTLHVEQGVATIEIKASEQSERASDEVRARLQRIPDMRDVVFVVATKNTRDGAQEKPGFWRGLGERIADTLGVSGETVTFPSGDVFWPLLADEKQPQFFVSLREYDTPRGTATSGAVAYGETFGLLRVRGLGDDRKEGLQFSVAGALFAQFDLDAPSSDLVNADYTIGGQLTYRRGATSTRLRLYHQSSHLGDEFLLRVNPERVNLSFESLEFLFARQWQQDQWRAYIGGEYLLRREPEELKPEMLHAGIEFYGHRPLLLEGRLVASIDLKSYHENDWELNRSLKAGLEFGRRGAGGRRVRLLAEIYRGASQHGQFFDEEIKYYGLGLYLGF